MTFGRRHLPQFGALVAFVADQHHGDLRDLRLQLLDDVPDRPQLLEALSRAHRVDEQERVALRYREPLHRRELVAARRVCYLQSANIFVATYHLLEEAERKEKKGLVCISLGLECKHRPGIDVNNLWVGRWNWLDGSSSVRSCRCNKAIGWVVQCVWSFPNDRLVGVDKWDFPNG